MPSTRRGLYDLLHWTHMRHALHGCCRLSCRIVPMDAWRTAPVPRHLGTVYKFIMTHTNWVLLDNLFQRRHSTRSRYCNCCCCAAMADDAPDSLASAAEICLSLHSVLRLNVERGISSIVTWPLMMTIAPYDSWQMGRRRVNTGLWTWQTWHAHHLSVSRDKIMKHERKLIFKKTALL